jgi:hypothetical protein
MLSLEYSICIVLLSSHCVDCRYNKVALIRSRISEQVIDQGKHWSNISYRILTSTSTDLNTQQLDIYLESLYRYVNKFLPG